MKEKKINIVVTIMTIAVIGLIAVQYYWLTNAIAVEEIRFNTNVNSALGEVVKKLNKAETARLIVKKLGNPGEDVFILNKDSVENIQRIKWNENNNILFSKKYKGKAPSKLQIQLEMKSGNDSDKISNKTNPLTLTKIDTGKRKITFDRKMDTVIFKKTVLVNEIVEELIHFQSKIPAEKKYNMKSIDSLLNNELHNKGISAEYSFKLLREDREASTNPDRLKTEQIHHPLEHRIQLNPDEVFNHASFLSITFPSQKTYIIKTISSVLAISILLILVIIGVFYSTVRMLIHQKKITEIKNDLINNITHEFKTPISTISIACDALNEPRLFGKPDAINRYSGMIRDENNRLSNLVENLLNTAAIEKGEFELNKELIDINELLENVVNNYRSKLEQKNGTLNIQLSPGSLKVYGDKFHLTNVVNNLIDNAYKYSPSNPVIALEIYSEGKFCVVKISDNGIGISKQNINKIFDTFYRVPTGNIHDVKGNGIGLSYVKKIVEAHNGSIEVKSKLNEGSVFIIKLPSAKDGQ